MENSTDSHDGPKAGRYDRKQGGKVKYDDDVQSEESGGHRRNASDPVCRGRNMVIVVSNIYQEPASARILQATQDGYVRMTVKVEAEAPASSAFYTSITMASLIILMVIFNLF